MVVTKYDTAQVCGNGHTITPKLLRDQGTGSKFCPKCGEQAISACQNCNEPVRGYHYVPGINQPRRSDYADYSPPGFRHNCGKPYLWTDNAVRAAAELIDTLNNLSGEEKDTLKKSIGDIVCDTPCTPVASNRVRTLAAKMGNEATEGLKTMLFNVASEAAKRLIWP